MGILIGVLFFVLLLGGFIFINAIGSFAIGPKNWGWLTVVGIISFALWLMYVMANAGMSVIIAVGFGCMAFGAWYYLVDQQPE